MKEFTFDLQRFADVCKIESTGKIYSKLSDAYNAAQPGDTITLLANRTENGFTISKNITVDLSGFTLGIKNTDYSDGYGSRAYTISSTVTFKNGTISSSYVNPLVNGSGNLTISDLKTNRSISSGTINVGSGNNVVAGSGTFVLDNGVKLKSGANATMTITTASDKTASVVLNNGRTLTAIESSSREVVYEASGTAITLDYDDSSGAASVTNLAEGSTLSVSVNNGTATTYTVTAGGLQATRDGKLKVLKDTAISASSAFNIENDLDFTDDTKFTSAILTDTSNNNNLTISDSLDLNETLRVIDSNDYSQKYGYLTKIANDTYTLNADDKTKSLSGITINDGLTVQLTKDFTYVPITVSKAATTFQYVTGEDVTLSSVRKFSSSSDSTVQAASVTGAVNVSLSSGAVKIAESDDTLKPTVNAGNYAVSYAKGSGDGVAVVIDGTSTQVSGIEKDESFIVNGTTYYRDDVGLRNSVGGVFTSDVASLSGGDDGYAAIELANLVDSIGEFVTVDSKNKVLEIGKNNMNYAVIVDDKDDPAVKYAEILVQKSSSSGNLYTLRAADGVADQFIDAVDTISLTGGAGTVIEKQLVDGVAIAASSGTKADATFLVTAVTGDTFTVNLKNTTTSGATEISTDATGITLQSGTINAKAGQTITLGEKGRELKVTTSSAGMEITVTPATAEGITTYTATIKGAANDVFSINGKEYTIDSNSDGMTFTVTADNVIVSDLDTADKDAFTYEGATYSVRGAGFVMTNKSGKHSLWSYKKDNEHSLDGGTVTIESLTASDHTWNPTASVRASDNSATLPPNNNDMTVTLVGNDFKQTYGTFTKIGTAVTLENGSSSNEAKLSRISVGSAVDHFDFGTDLTDISIVSGVATFIVSEDDDDGKGYQVTLTSSSPAMVSSAKRASLISGSLQSDSYFTATVRDNYIIAQGDASVTLIAGTSDASVTGLTVGQSFSIEGNNNYVMSKVGLVDNNSRYLPGTREGNPILLSSLNTDAAWGGLIDKDSITINATTGTALIVDFATLESGGSEPVTLYADYTSGTKSFTKSNSADDWDDNIVINVDNTTVNFSDYFEDAKIAGVQSGAQFSVEDNLAFTVQDARTGAVIGSAKNISQTGGTIALSNGQSIHSAAATVSASLGNGITYGVDGSDATIGSMNSSTSSAVNDVFVVSTAAGNVTYTRNAVGLVTGDDRIWTKNNIADTVTVADLLTEDNWTSTVYITNNNLAIPPVTKNVDAPWVILSSNKEIRYGTLATLDGGGYSVTKSSLDSVWASSATFSINADPVTFSRDFSGARIRGVQSGASVTAVDATGEFTFNDGTAGATITGDGSNKINQLAGTVIPQNGQTIIGGSYSISSGANDAIAVSVAGSNVRINELSKGDTFAINGNNFEILDNGVVRRNGNQLWQNGQTWATAANLVNGNAWYGFATIEADQNLTVSSALVNNVSTGQSYIVDKDNYDNIYGTISTISGGYKISTDGANVPTFTSVTIAEEVESVTFVKDHFITSSIPITAGDATFIVTGTTSANTFSVNYDYTTKTANVGTATALTLTDGTLTLSNTAQTVTAGGQTIKVAAGTITANVNGDTVTVGSLDTAKDSVVLNGETYTYVSGNGMTITVADGVTKFTNLDDDSFTIGSYTYTKTTNGFVKTSSSGTDYMWVNDSVDVTEGVDVSLLKSTDAKNWKPIAAITDGKITIDSSSTDTVVLVGDLNNPTETIYGTLTVDGSSRSLTKDGGANTTLTSITVDGVTVSISSDFGTVPIIPQNNATINTDGTLTFTPANGESFIVNGTTYIMTSSGSLTTGDKIWTSSDKKTYTLPNADAPWGVYNGTVTLNEGDSITVTDGTTSGVKISVESGSITATATKGNWTSIGGLNAGDTFTIGSTSYKILSDGKTIGLYDANGKITKKCAGIADDGTIDYDDITTSGNYTAVLTLTGDNLDILDLTSIPTWTTAPVWGTDDAGDPDPTKNIATVKYSSSSGYNLTDPGTNVGDMTSISLGDVKTFTTTIYKPVTTPASGTYSINGSSFTAAEVLTITPNEGGAILTDGKVTLSAGKNVTTASGTIKATNGGAITVDVDDTTITIGELSSGKVFSVGDTEYTMTALGLKKDDTTLLSVSTTVTIEQLNGTWDTIYEATNGALTIDSDTPVPAAVVDSTNANRYGNLTKSDSSYTYTKTDKDLTSVTVNGVKANLPATSVTIKANSATFTASGDLTVDASTTIPTISASTINLTAGTINAPNDVEITVGGRKITATNGSLTVGLVGSSVQIGALDNGDKFTVGSVEYEMTSAGLYIAKSGQLVTDGLSSDMKTYTVGDVTIYDTIVTLTNGVLDLTGTPSDGYTALVVSKTNGSADPTKKIARVTYSATDGYTLSEQGTYFSELTQVDLSEVKTFTTELETTVTTPASGTYTIKGNSFTAASALTIKTDSNGATLTDGTVSLTNGSVTTPSGTLTATSGTIIANVDGSTLTIGNLSNGSAFTFGGKSYTMTAIGLSCDSQLLDVSGSVTAADLSGGDWQTVKQATNGALTIDTSDGSALVVDTTANPAVKYGTLTKTDSGYTFTQNTALTSITLNGVKATLPETSVAIKANSATFVADGELTVDATTSIPTITGATTLTVTAGTVNAPNDLEITIGGMKFTATNGAMTIGLEDDNVVVGALNVGDKFTVGNTEYEMTSAGLYIAANNRLVTSGLSDNNTKYTVGTIVYDSVVTLTDGVLDLTDTPAAGYTAYVVSKTNGAADPTKKIAKVSYDGTGYTLSEQGNYFSELKSVSLSEVKTLTTQLETTVTTPESGTFTINDKTFAASSALQIKTAKDSATLTDGTVSLTNSSVTTTAGTLTATSGTITATVDGSALTIGNLSTGDAFDFGGASYSMTSIGLSNETRLLQLDDDSVTATELSTGNWLAVEQAPSGNLSIDTSTGSALIVDTAVSPAVIYGTLTKSDSGYTFAQDVELKNITVNGVKATFPATTATVTTSSAVFTASGDFTVDDTTANTNIDGATAITLNSGTINAPEDVEITVGSRKVTATNGDMTVGLQSGKLTIGNLIAGDTFSIGSADYKVTSIGELYTDGKIVTSFSNGTFVVDDAAYVPIIKADGTNLDLTGVTEDAYVYDSATNPSKRLATLDVSGVKKELKGTSNNVITTIDLGDGSVLDNDFPATISASGSATVNGSEYKGTGSLTIISDGTTSTLYEGDISLDPLSAAPELTSDKSTLTVNNGTLTANVVNGKIEKVSSLKPGVSFNFNNTAYTQTKLGLVSNSTIREDLAGESVAVSKLGSGSEFLSPDSDGTLDLTSASANAIVYDDRDNPSKKLATLTISNGKLILDGNGSNANDIKAIRLGDGSNLTVDFTTQIRTTAATVNSQVFNGTGDLLIDAKSKAATLYDGTVTLGSTAASVKASKGSSVAVTGSTSITATANNGVFVRINDLGAGEAFTYGGKTYTQTPFGLVTGNTVCEDLISSTINLDELGNATFKAFTAPVNGTLDLTKATANSAIYNSYSNPTRKLADLTVTDKVLTLAGTNNASDISAVKVADGADLTLNFATKVQAPKGSVTVNAQSYTATSDLILDSDGITSTLTDGSISIPAAQSVVTTSGKRIVANVGDKAFTLDAKGSTLTIGGLATNSNFSVDRNEYFITDAALFKKDAQNNSIYTATYSDNVTIAQLDGNNWGNVIKLDDTALDVSGDSTGGYLVSSDLGKLYGSLSKTTGGYTLTKGNANAQLSAVNVNGTALTMAPDFATVDLSTSKASFDAVKLGDSYANFTLDDSGAAPNFSSNVNAFTLDSGRVAATNAQTVTADNHTVSGDVLITNDDNLVVSEISSGETFALDGKAYKSAEIGLINSDDSALVTAGFENSALNVDAMQEDKFIAANNGTLDLTEVTQSAPVLDSATNPTKQVATLTVDNGKLMLNGTNDNTVDTVKVATDSDLTVDFAAQVQAPIGSATVNKQSYLGTTDLTLQSDGTTSKLANGTVSLGIGDSVTTGENTITATAGDITVNVNGDSITLGGLNDGDAFTVDGTAYKVCAAGLVSGDELYTSDEATTVAALSNDTNWTHMLSASYGAFAVNAGTLDDGGEVILVDSTTNPTKTYGTLNKTDGEYLLMKDDTEDDKLGAITVAGTIINVDTELADVPITTVNADESESVFTVKPTAGAITFRVDATGNSPKIDGVDEIDLISGKVQPQDGQIINPPEGGDGEITISYGNGEHKIGDKTVIVDGLDDGDTVDFELDENGNIKKITGLPKGATITIDGTTYTSPFDNATLTYTDEDGWYFDGWTLPEYSVTIDKDGNIKVDTGIRFRNVISSGRTLGEDGSIQLSGERGDSSVKITNESGVLLKVNDSDASTLAENLAADKGVTFGTDGVATDDLQAVAGATINLGEGQSLTAGDDTTVTAPDGDGAKVEVNENSINVDGAAQIEAPADTALNLGAGDYSVNGVEFTSGEKTQATATADGVEFNLADSTGLTYDGMNLTGDENATAAVNSDGAVTLTDGAIADNTTGKTLTIAGAVQLDDKTVNVDTATAVTSTDKGLNVGETELEVEGDDDGYIINIAASAIIGLENIGSASGVTVGGLDDASIKSDKAGPLTVGDKTFRTSDNSVTWIDDGQIAEVGDVEGTVSGDFSDGLTVNGENIQVQSDKNSEVEVVADADGVKEIQATEADKYTINGKKYETEGEIKFNMSGGSVTGVETDDATFAIGQNETNFTVNDETLNLSQNTKPVTLDVDGGAVSGVYGVDGAISGLSEATVYDLTKATVNGTPLNVSGSTFDAVVDGGAVSSIIGVSAPATINSAPNLSIVTNGDGAFTFGGNTYHVSDTLDSSVTFTTDENSGLTAINDFVGSVSGAVNTLNLNGKDFGTNNGNVTVGSDGENITTIDGVQSGDSIGGEIDKASFTMPEGNLTINGGEFILEDNDGDAQASAGGKIITGIAKDASLTVGADGNYQVNGRGAQAQAGGVFTVNRDGSYLINPNFLPIIEKTPASEILGRSGGGLQLVTSNGTVGAGKDSVAVRNGANVVIQGEPLIVATSGSVTLENYTGAASIGTFEYLNLGNAIKTNSVMFGDGVMTLGDAVITFEEGASSNGATRAQLLNAQGKEQKIGFTHTAGGTINASNETADLVLKGNYAEKSNDPQKSGGSNLIGGSGNDMLLIGGGDTADGGAGNNQIYLTNSNLRELGAVIIFGGGSDTVHNFNGGYGVASDEIIISDLNAIEFSAGASELVMRSGDATLTFTGMRKGNNLTTIAESSDAASTYDDSYRLKLNNGSTTYNAAVAQAGRNIVVANGDLANVFYGDGSGVNFSEYAGAVAVNLNNGNGNIGGASAQFNGITKLTGGAGNTSLVGAADVSNTLTAGTGDGVIWSNSGNDLMIGNTSATKTGFTTFNYLANDGQDTISGFDFANDWIDITTANEVTSVSVSGSDVVMFINGSETDYLTLAQGKGNDFRINNLTAQVDERTLEFDGLANCFVATGTNATMEVGAEVTEATIWLSDGKTSLHGSYYLGDITVLDASKSAGSLILVGNDLNNTILGGAGENSIYGGLGDDVLIGGDGKNTFFFAMVSGNDVIQSAHDGDVIDLGALTAADFAGTAIDGSGTAIALTDGSLLEVRSNAAVEYKTADGTYTADHTTGTWTKK